MKTHVYYVTAESGEIMHRIAAATSIEHARTKAKAICGPLPGGFKIVPASQWIAQRVIDTGAVTKRQHVQIRAAIGAAVDCH